MGKTLQKLSLPTYSETENGNSLKGTENLSERVYLFHKSYSNSMMSGQCKPKI